jgi:hypothetical protein
MKPPKLTEKQLERLHHLEPLLKDSARRGDYDSAQRLGIDIQNILRPTGHETRLMQAKLWVFEAALQAERLDVAIPGITGVRQKTAKNTRINLEATSLLAICFLRQKALGKAEPLIKEVLESRNIRSEDSRRRFLHMMVSRFEEEGLLATLMGQYPEELDPKEIQSLAAEAVRTSNEDEIFCEIGKALPPASVDFLLQVDRLAKRGPR